MSFDDTRVDEPELRKILESVEHGVPRCSCLRQGVRSGGEGTKTKDILSVANPRYQAQNSGVDGVLAVITGTRRLRAMMHGTVIQIRAFFAKISMTEEFFFWGSVLNERVSGQGASSVRGVKALMSADREVGRGRRGGGAVGLCGVVQVAVEQRVFVMVQGVTHHSELFACDYPNVLRTKQHIIKYWQRIN